MDWQAFWDMVHEFMTTRQVLGFDAWRIAAAIGVLLVIYLARKYILGIVMGFLFRLSKRTVVKWDDKLFEALQPPIGAVLQVLNIYAALAILNLPRHPTDYDAITNGYHFQQGRTNAAGDIVMSDDFNLKKPWVLSSGMYGKW